MRIPFLSPAAFSFPLGWPLLSLGLAVAGWGGALISQYVLGMDPCPLCIAQRVALSGYILSLLVWMGLRSPLPRISVFFAWLAFSSSLAGAGVAARHLWIVHFPPPSSCGADFGYLIDALPLSRWLPLLFSGEAECSAAGAKTVLFLTLPSWSLLLFLALSLGFLLRLILWRHSASV